MSLAQAIKALPPVISPADAKPGPGNCIQALEHQLAAYKIQQAALFLLDWRTRHDGHTFLFSTDIDRSEPGTVNIKGVDRNSLVCAEFEDEDAVDEFVCEMNEQIEWLVETIADGSWHDLPSFHPLIDALNHVGWDMDQVPGVIAQVLDKSQAHGSQLLASIQAEQMAQATPVANPGASPGRKPIL